MSIPNLQNYVPTTDISELPTIQTANNQAIIQSFADINDILKTSNNLLKLTNFIASPPAGSAEVASIFTTANTGIVFSVSPDGAAAVATISALGDAIFNALTVGGQTNLEDLAVAGEAVFAGGVTFSDAVNFSGSKVSKSTLRVALSDGNIGSGASSPVDISGAETIFLNYAGVTIAGGVNIDLTTLVANQEFNIILLQGSPSGEQALFNGGVGTERFAVLEPTGSGFLSVSSASLIEFSSLASPDNISSLKVKWMDIGAGNFRFVILDAKNISNI